MAHGVYRPGTGMALLHRPADASCLLARR